MLPCVDDKNFHFSWHRAERQIWAVPKRDLLLVRRSSHSQTGGNRQTSVYEEDDSPCIMIQIYTHTVCTPEVERDVLSRLDPRTVRFVVQLMRTDPPGLL